jgi:hypothetical protein
MTERTSDTPENASPPGPEDKGAPDRRDASTEPAERPLFQHPQWMLGVVLVFAVVAIIAGLDNPVWLLIGSPCILVLLVWIWVKLRAAE